MKARLLLLALVLPALLSAQTVVFNNTSLTTYTSTYTMQGTSVPEVAQRFTTAASGPLTLSAVSLRVNSVASAAWQPVIGIYTSNGTTPGTTLVGSLTSDSGTIGLTGTLATYTFSGSVDLAASTTYWVIFSDSDHNSTVDFAIAQGSSGGTGTWLQSGDYSAKVHSSNGTVWNPPATGFSLFMTMSAVTAVPEPATWAALAGLAALGLVLHRRRRAAR